MALTAYGACVMTLLFSASFLSLAAVTDRCPYQGQVLNLKMVKWAEKWEKKNVLSCRGDGKPPFYVGAGRSC